MKKYLFLLAWVEGSDSASGDPTNVHQQKDLWTEYQRGSEYVFALVIQAPNEEVAEAVGYARAFHDNYTGYDTVSTLILLDEVVQAAAETPVIVVDCSQD